MLVALLCTDILIDGSPVHTCSVLRMLTHTTALELIDSADMHQQMSMPKLHMSRTA